MERCGVVDAFDRQTLRKDSQAVMAHLEALAAADAAAAQAFGDALAANGSASVSVGGKEYAINAGQVKFEKTTKKVNGEAKGAAPLTSRRADVLSWRH